ncbi:MAG: 1-acyl-sn-glycerol-3-phosphate acyltransferase [Flavobacteriales bacterium]
MISRRTSTKSLLYAILVPWVRCGVRWFFRRVEIRNRELVPADKPTILVANHQNALLDPVLISLFTKKQCHWLTRSDVFKKPAVAKILHRLNMLPIFRERDKVSDISEKNAEIFQVCNERLKKGAMICLFPEGTHRGRKQLATLKKGTVRLISGAMQRGVRDIHIIPVGIELGDFYSPDTTLLLQFGQPIRVEDYYNSEEIQQAKNQNDLTRHIWNALLPGMIHIDDDELYDDLIFIQHLIVSVHPNWSLSKKFEVFQQLVIRLKEEAAQREEFMRLWSPWIAEARAMQINPEVNPEECIALCAMKFLFLFPLALLGWLYFRPIHALAEWIVSTKIQDTLFYNSIRVSVWTFATPLYSAITFFAMLLFMPWICAAASLGILIASSIFVKAMVRTWQRLKDLRSMGIIASKNPDRWKSWLKGRQDAVIWLQSIIKGF